MSFKDLEIRDEYRSLLNSVVAEFYTPVLSEAILYRRAVGFFSSSSLVELTNGLAGLLRNNGTIELIASPRLSEEDISAIEDGFERRDVVILDCLLRELKDPKGKFEEKRLNLLSNLIAANRLVIKIAILEDNNEIGMFHEKLGLLYDKDGNVIAFSGSMNESANAFSHNYESIDVFTSWSDDARRVRNKEAAFTAMWNDYEPCIRVLDFPDISRAIIEKYRTGTDIDIEDLEYPMDDPAHSEISRASEHLPHIPEGVIIREYQNMAIKHWAEANYRGIFDMATGTGKTYTALAAIVHLSEQLSHHLATVIVCPYMHLVEQWTEDIVAFGLRPIICYSQSKQSDWKKRVKDSVIGFNIGAMNGFCIITTNSTFSGSFLQENLSKLEGNALLVVDEAHNFGTEKLSRTLLDNFNYRLALSATIDRYGDADGTQRLYDYFGNKCIEYSLKEAIDNGMLTPYYYYPVPVALNEDELDEYLSLTSEISVAVHSSPNRKKDGLSDYAKKLLIERARIIAGAAEKIPKLRETITPYINDNHMLIYCGATTIHDVGYVEGVPSEDDIRQIDAVKDLLGNRLGMKIAQFTSEESTSKREQLKAEFSEGKHQQALVAIRCLDEGVNIPSIKLAFILASSTNPKEYVQRRGRVLRTFKDKHFTKNFAVIFDFITLPFHLEQAGSYPDEVIRASKSLALREIVRMRDFASISENPSDATSLISEITRVFDITPDDEEKISDEY